MEAMRGPKWKALVRRENERFDAALASAAGGRQEALEGGVASFEAARLEAELAGEWHLGDFLLRPQPGGAVAWSWRESTPILSGDLDIEGTLVAYTIDLKSGGEQYELVVRDLKKIGGQWSYRHAGGGLGASVAILGERVYCLEADEPLRYKRLVSLSLKGGERRVEYEEEDASAVLSIFKGDGGCLFFIVDLAGKKRLYHVKEVGGVKLLTRKGESCVVPVGYSSAERGSGDPCYFVRENGLRGRWIPRGRVLRALFSRALPVELQKSEDFGIDLACLSWPGAIVTREHGKRTIWIGKKKRVEFFGEVEQHPLMFWKGVQGASDPNLLLFRPGAVAQRATFSRDGLQIHPLEFPAYAPHLQTGFATSADGTKVRWLFCCGTKPRALLVTVYGAYGLPTKMITSRWKPYLDRGFAIGFACVRGGGDHTESWASLGQVEGKRGGVEDFEACVTAMRGVLGLPKKAVGIFGRSAGGYIVGAAAGIRSKKEREFESLYTEVPYVDVLKTASNPALPLTEFEYEEFGDPAHSIADFETVLRLSPVDVAIAAPPGHFDDLLVVCRTSENDRQVFAYESMKWIMAMRSRERKGGAVEKKLVAITEGQGHFSFGGAASFQRAEDYLLLSEKMLKS